MGATSLVQDMTRAAIEDFLYEEAALLDEWRLQEWLDLLTEDATYEVPSTDTPDGDARTTLFTSPDTRLEGRNLSPARRYLGLAMASHQRRSYRQCHVRRENLQRLMP